MIHSLREHDFPSRLQAPLKGNGWLAPRGLSGKVFPPKPTWEISVTGIHLSQEISMGPWSLPVYFFLMLKRASKRVRAIPYSPPPAALFVWISSALLGDNAAVLSAQLHAVVDSVENSLFVWISSARLGDTAAVVSAQLLVDSVENSFITLHTLPPRSSHCLSGSQSSVCVQCALALRSWGTWGHWHCCRSVCAVACCS